MMQLDLLQDEAKTQDTATPPKKVKRPQREFLAAPKVEAAAESKLPQSLRAPFIAEESLPEERDIIEKAPEAFKTISETAKYLDVPQHVLRFWESRFSQIKPLKLNGGRRYYRPQDIDILTTIKHLLYKQGYTIKGAKKAFTAERQNIPAMTREIPASTAIAGAVDKTQLIKIRQELMDLRDSLRMQLSK